eukprot:CAMPEP_0170602438 /NCGR_PEP_ID=MMETSP0224-20130122/18388_1 /TAXON_ID=285029 /ORGANISM="Togula jolla, Strain CCCM 725" /LENGTH=380 /DNA_ID=CAMNT_0010927271 /DNA_START=62 /DNA_END=1202 /DNA_ORIENTATION=+
MRAAFAIVALAAGASALPSLRAHVGSQLQEVPRNSSVPTSEAVEAERTSITHYVTSLNALLNMNAGPLGGSKVGPTLRVFAQKLTSVLEETKSIKDPVLAMSKLKAAKGSVSALVKDLTTQQASLMAEDAAQRESLLLGVLMARQTYPIAEQMEVLKSVDFASLPVVQELLHRHNATTPLYQQVAQYLDKHHGVAGAAVSSEVIRNVTLSKEAVARGHMLDLAAKFEKRVTALQLELDTRSKQHEAKMEQLNKQISKVSTHDARLLKYARKREERNYKKWVATREHDLKSMRAAADAMRTGDIEAIKRIQRAMAESLKAMKSNGQGFLVLIQQGQGSLHMIAHIALPSASTLAMSAGPLMRSAWESALMLPRGGRYPRKG